MPVYPVYLVTQGSQCSVKTIISPSICQGQDLSSGLSIVVNAGFSFFERLLRFLEDQKERKRGHVQLLGAN